MINKVLLSLIAFIIGCLFAYFFLGRGYVDFYNGYQLIVDKNCNEGENINIGCARQLCEKKMNESADIAELQTLKIHSKGSLKGVFSILLKAKINNKMQHYFCNVNNNIINEITKTSANEFDVKNYSYIYDSFETMSNECKKNKNINFKCAEFLCGSVLSASVKEEEISNIYAIEMTSDILDKKKFSVLMLVEMYNNKNKHYSCMVSNNTVTDILSVK